MWFRSPCQCSQALAHLVRIRLQRRIRARCHDPHGSSQKAPLLELWGLMRRTAATREAHTAGILILAATRRTTRIPLESPERGPLSPANIPISTTVSSESLYRTVIATADLLPGTLIIFVIHPRTPGRRPGVNARFRVRFVILYACHKRCKFNIALSSSLRAGLGICAGDLMGWFGVRVGKYLSACRGCQCSSSIASPRHHKFRLTTRYPCYRASS